MKEKKKFRQALLAFAMLFSCNAFSQATFEDLTLPADTFWNGSDQSGGFTSGGLFFSNSFTDYGSGMYAWSGFGYSNQTDTLTAGYGSQYSSFAGGGALGSSNYGVSAFAIDYMNNNVILPNYVSFPGKATLSGFYACNNTYAGISMRDGDSFCKKFGGVSGNDPDWFRLSVFGFNNGALTDTVDFYLADFRFSNNAQDYIVRDWSWVDLTSLGIVDSVGMTVSSTDTGAYGMNTPAYFCLDQFTFQCLGIQNQYVGGELSLYPNPAQDYVRINPNGDFDRIEVYSASGVRTDVPLHRSEKNVVLDVSNLQQGIYTVVLVRSGSLQTAKWIKL